MDRSTGVTLRPTAARLNALRYANGQLGTRFPSHDVVRPLLAAGYLRASYGADVGDRGFWLTPAGKALLDLWESGAS